MGSLDLRGGDDGGEEETFFWVCSFIKNGAQTRLLNIDIIV